MINHVTKLGNVGVGGKNPVRIMGILNTSPESFYKKSIKITKQQITNTIKQILNKSSEFFDRNKMKNQTCDAIFVL